MCSLSLSLKQLADRLDSLAYIEGIADAYSQYFVNDIEHTENNKQGQKCKLALVPITLTIYCQILHGLPLIF